MRFIKTADATKRKAFFAGLSPEERAAVANLLEYIASNPWARFQSDPVGFVQEGLGETLWSKQIEILQSIRDNKRTAVPACHAPGKSHLAARAVAWWICAHEPHTTMVVTTATTFRQVRNILWREVRRLAARHNMVGEVLTTEWKIDGTVVAFGFAPQAHDETAVQGIHAPNLLVVVDEAGGVSETIGNALEALMTGDNTRLLLLGNPPTDNEDSWFERACNSPLYNVIPIPAYATPAYTGEEVGQCQTCPRTVPPHPITKHLVDRQWVDDVISELGEDSPFVIARVKAEFPRVTGNKVLPITWLEEAEKNDNPVESDAIRLGVDVAADGGDEFAIARADGFKVRILHSSAGAVNQNAVDVAGKVLEFILEAEKDLGRDKKQVQVKIDTIGVGWGVVSILQKWAQEGRCRANIVAVNVAERAREAGKFKNQRAEMWWNARTLVQPDKQGTVTVRLNVDRRTLTQLAGPTYYSDSSGRIVIESKADMKKRGVSSPDRGEAVLLALYDPPRGGGVPVVAPIGLDQVNPWT